MTKDTENPHAGDATVKISRAALSTLCELAGYRIDQWQHVAEGRDPMDYSQEFYESDAEEASWLVGKLLESYEAGLAALEVN
jgi:hypothetical protein